MPAIKMNVGGTESSVTLYAPKSIISGESIRVTIANKDFYALISNDLQHEFMTSLRTKINGTTYGFLSKRTNANTIVLTDSHYKMSDLYPDTYQTMTSIPDNLDVSQLTTMKEMFAGCVKLKSVPAFNTSKITTFIDAFKECDALGIGDFPWSIDVRSVTGYKENYWPFWMFTYEHSANQPHFSKVRFINATDEQKNYLMQNNKPQTYVWMDKYDTQSVEIISEEMNPYGYIIYGSGTSSDIDWDAIKANAVESKVIDIPNGVTEIPASAFSGLAGIQKVNIPDSVTKIGEYAFCGCSFDSSSKFTFDNIKEIGDYAFKSCKKANFNPDNCYPYLGSMYARSMPTLVFPKVEIIGERAFEYCCYMHLTLNNSDDEGISSIGDKAFWETRGFADNAVGSSRKAYPVSIRLYGSISYHKLTSGQYGGYPNANGSAGIGAVVYKNGGKVDID